MFLKRVKQYITMPVPLFPLREIGGQARRKGNVNYWILKACPHVALVYRAGISDKSDKSDESDKRSLIPAVGSCLDGEVSRRGQPAGSVGEAVGGVRIVG